MTDLEQNLLNDYTRRFELLIRVCHEFEKEDKAFYTICLKKAAGIKMLMDYMTDNDGCLNPKNS